MLNCYIPTWQVKSIYHLTPEMLKEHDIQLVLTDLDNTLIPWNRKNGTFQARKWIETMQNAGIQVMVVSNNTEKRVKEAADSLDVDFVFHSLKPFGRGIRQALKKTGCKREHAVMIGDQLMTDICAAHHAKIRSILVAPIVESDSWNTQVNRILEMQVKKQLSKQMTWQWKEEI